MRKAISTFTSGQGEKKVIDFYNKKLNSWPVPQKNYYISTEWTETHIIECGDKALKPLILFHGINSNSTLFKDRIQNYCKSHRVFAVDIPGDFGKSVIYKRMKTIDQVCCWFQQLLEKLHLERVNFIGGSFGGYLGLHLAMRQPHLFNSLAAIVPPGLAPFDMSCMKKLLLFSLKSKTPFFTRKDAEKMTAYLFDTEDDINRDFAEELYLLHKYCRYQNKINITLFDKKALEILQVRSLVILGKNEVMYDSKTALNNLIGINKNIKVEMIEDDSHIIEEKADCLIEDFFSK